MNKIKSEQRKIMRTVNCYLCEVQMKYNMGIKKSKVNGGDIFIWCKPCHKKTFVKKITLLRR